MAIAKGQVFAFWTELALCAAILVMIWRARKGLRIPDIAKVPGLDALDEAIGRATEMGRPIHYSPGIDGLQQPQTLASMSVLGYVAKQSARYGAKLIVTNKVSTVHPIAEAVVRQSYLEEGKGDEVRPETVRFISEDQFAYTSGVNGIMFRERPAANLMIGSFWAEAVIIAENAAAIGAIQIAGTTNTHQIPTFITSCDYVLIGEEMYAASAYLTREPVRMGSIVAQDFGKAVAVVLVLAATLFRTLGIDVFDTLLRK